MPMTPVASPWPICPSPPPPTTRWPWPWTPIAEAGRERAGLICFPECYVPGYRAPGKAGARRPMQRSWSAPGRRVAAAAAAADVAVVLGTERFVNGRAPHLDAGREPRRHHRRLARQAAARSVGGSDCSPPGDERRVFQAGALTFGLAICHEGWRYPEDGALGGAARRAGGVPAALPRSRAGQLPAHHLRRSAPTPSTRRRCCAAPPRTPAGSPA